MKRFIKPIAILCLMLCAIGLVPAQQLQPLEETDSFKQRRVKTNENFTLLNSKIANLGVDLTSSQTFENKTFKLPRIFSYTKATLPVPGQSGRIAFVTDDASRFYFDTGAAWAPIINDSIGLEWFGGKPDGVTDNRAVFNAALASLSETGLTLQLQRGVYALSGPLNGSYSNITIVGQGATIKHISDGPPTIYAAIMHQDFGAYHGWTLRGITFDGGAPGDYGITFQFASTRALTFEHCEFRRLHGYIAGQGLDRLIIRDCKFWGTAPGVMQANAQDPPAVAGAALTGAINLAGDCNNVTIENNYFHFCETGVAHSGNSNDHSRTWRVRGNVFRGDWFNMPYIVYRGAATAYDNGTKTLTFGAGGLTGRWPDGDYRMIAVPVTVTTGSSLSINSGIITFPSSVGTLREGDVIETSNGRRAEIISQQSSTQVTIARWESSDTFEPAASPGSVSWRITRLYSSAATITSDTTVSLYNEPENPFTGELIVTGASLSPVGKNCRIFALQIYSGFHNNGGLDDLEVSGNHFRGSRSDQCSNFDTAAPRIHDNHFELGFDQDITLTSCPGAQISGNRHRLSGVSGVSVGGTSGGIVIVGEQFNSWGLVNRNGFGAIDGAGVGMVITGCTFNVLAGSGGIGGASARAISLLYAASSAGTVITDNIDNGARVASLDVSAETGKIIVRDFKTIIGAGAANVYTAMGPEFRWGDGTNDLARLDGNGNYFLSLGFLYLKKTEGIRFGFVDTDAQLDSPAVSTVRVFDPTANEVCKFQAGLIESQAEGFKFPDATIQTTAAVGEQLLAKGVVVDMDNVTNQDVYTVPASKTLVITRIVAREASGDMTGQTLRIYSSQTANRLVSMDLVSLTTASGYDIITLDNENGSVDTREIIGAGFKVQAHPKTAYGSPATIKVDLFGYFIDL